MYWIVSIKNNAEQLAVVNQHVNVQSYTYLNEK